jgi:hypothetical protein
MEPIPECRKDPSEDVTDDRRCGDKEKGNPPVKGADYIWRIYEMQPEGPIHDGLSPSNQDEKSPKGMKQPEKNAENHACRIFVQ